MQQQIYGEVLKPILVVLGTLLFLSGCSQKPPPEVKVVTQAQKVTIPVVARPKPVQLSDVQVHVVTEKNLEKFIKEFTAENGELAVVAMSMRDYENLALNISELRRFILQSTDIIVYYEDAVKPEEAKTQQQDNGSTISNFFK